jgi:hypothetical protein
VFPTLGELPVKDITLQMWPSLLEALAEDIPGIADRILTNSKQFLKWCRKRQVISVNPREESIACSKKSQRWPTRWPVNPRSGLLRRRATLSNFF